MTTNQSKQQKKQTIWCHRFSAGERRQIVPGVSIENTDNRSIRLKIITESSTRSSEDPTDDKPVEYP
jgi:hypothetical protein